MTLFVVEQYCILLTRGVRDLESAGSTKFAPLLVLPRLGSRDRSASIMTRLPLCSHKSLRDVYVMWHAYKNHGFVSCQVTWVVPIMYGAL
jgi:hypothetical protein